MVLDVVYNHTVAAGQDPRSVLDRIVPGYYHRLSATGAVENSTCCSNTAAEHAMMDKLIVDSVLLWARQYKVGGFRFDLMGHHPQVNDAGVRSALDALTPAADGVDGPPLYVYGEGWNFGEVAGNARFVQATQAEHGRDRDRHVQRPAAGCGPRRRPVRRGSADPGFRHRAVHRPQRQLGGRTAGRQQRDALLHAQDRIKIGLTGNLTDYPLIDRFGAVVTGSQVDYNGSPTGYAAEPSEVISYVDAHDNETLFDALTIKLPTATTMADRVRMNTLCLATVALGQGPMFWHAGTDLLRSKSLDRNSFNSGDWFNRVDWTGQDNTFGSGLPPAADNQPKWPVLRPLLADPALRARRRRTSPRRTPAALDLLRIRFVLPAVPARVGGADRRPGRISPVGGPDQAAGVITMVIDDGGLGQRREQTSTRAGSGSWWSSTPARGGRRCRSRSRRR